MSPDSQRQLQKSRTRQRLLIAARVLFERQDYESVTMRGIAKAADVSTGAIFNNWPGKAEVYREAMGHAPITPAQGRKLFATLEALGHDPLALLAA